MSAKYAAGETQVDAFVEENKDLINKTGPDDVVAKYQQANNLRKRLISTWYGIMILIIVTIMIIGLLVMISSALLNASVFSKVKVGLLVALVIVACFLFYL